ncbi:hypothetical protein ACFC6U_02610 [Kitasatospora purpeofusca]|uniref:hypothetical protein n=1 Tax=Kitasatospora purpeofusca TaxID=67352 RepID=UPI0035D85857
MPSTTTVRLPAALVAALADRDALQGPGEEAVAAALFENATYVKRGKGHTAHATMTAEQIGVLADYLHSLLGLVDSGIARASEFGVSRSRLDAIVRDLGQAQDATEAQDARRP